MYCRKHALILYKNIKAATALANPEITLLKTPPLTFVTASFGTAFPKNVGVETPLVVVVAAAGDGALVCVALPLPKTLAGTEVPNKA
jgi:hypothetical protein